MAGEHMSPEKYFLKYAYPCSFVLVEQGKMSEDKRKELENKLLKNQSIDRTELETLFPAAFKRIKLIAKEMGKDYWDVDVLKAYFPGGKHNHFIDKKDGMYAVFGPTFCDLCKIHKAKVLEKKDNVLTIKYGDTVRKVFATLVPEVKIGDNITVHFAFAIEKVD